jgi:uncharacterized protein (TIGR02001 family)
MKPLCASVSLLASLLGGGGAVAQTKAPTPDYTLSYSMGAGSDHRYRGLSQTSLGPAPHGGRDVAHQNGLYLGAWASNMKWFKEFNGATQCDYDLDLYGGYKSQLSSGLGLDLGLITYRYLGNNAGAAGTYGSGPSASVNTTAFVGAASYNIVTLKYSQSVGDFLGNPNSTAGRYWEVSANLDLGRGLTLTPRVGRQTIAYFTSNLGDYTDYALTLAKDFSNGLVLSAAAVVSNAEQGFYTDSLGDKKFLGKSTVVLGLKYNF